MSGGWRITPNANGITYEVLDKDGVSVAVVFAWEGGKTLRRARLIAAAPELLEATAAMLANQDDWLETGVPASPDESRRLYDMMKTAYGLALGGRDEQEATGNPDV